MLAHGVGDAGTVIDHDEGAGITLSRRSNEYSARTRVPRVAEHLDDDVLDATDVMFCLAPLGLANAQTNEALTK